MTISSEAISNVHNSSAIIDKYSKEIAASMYSKLFSQYPGIKEMFQNAPSNQHEVLAETISGIAVNINNLAIFQPVLDKIAYKHVQVGVKPNHYPIITEMMLSAFEDVLSDKVQNISIESLLSSWKEAITLVSELLIEKENKIYKELAKRN